MTVIDYVYVWHLSCDILIWHDIQQEVKEPLQWSSIARNQKCYLPICSLQKLVYLHSKSIRHYIITHVLHDTHEHNSGLRFDVMNKLNARGGLFVGQKAAAAAGARM